MPLKILACYITTNSDVSLRGSAWLFANPWTIILIENPITSISNTVPFQAILIEEPITIMTIIIALIFCVHCSTILSSWWICRRKSRKLSCWSLSSRSLSCGCYCCWSLGCSSFSCNWSLWWGRSLSCGHYSCNWSLGCSCFSSNLSLCWGRSTCCCGWHSWEWLVITRTIYLCWPF